MISCLQLNFTTDFAKWFSPFGAPRRPPSAIITSLLALALASLTSAALIELTGSPRGMPAIFMITAALIGRYHGYLSGYVVALLSIVLVNYFGGTAYSFYQPSLNDSLLYIVLAGMVTCAAYSHRKITSLSKQVTHNRWTETGAEYAAAIEAGALQARRDILEMRMSGHPHLLVRRYKAGLDQNRLTGHEIGYYDEIGRQLIAASILTELDGTYDDGDQLDR